MGVMDNLSLRDSALLITKGLIGAHWTGSDDGSTFEVLNPATGEVIGELPKMGGSETTRAISAAEHALSVWKEKTGKERFIILRKWHDLIAENAEDLAKIITLENGKPFKQAANEVQSGNDFVEWMAEEAKRIYGDIIPHPSAGKRIFVLKQPIGVVGAINPWNFPADMALRKISTALAAGCTMVLKPSELTPLSTLAIAQLGLRAGFPPGAVNVVMGDASAVGKALLDSAVVRKLAFTGSTAVGKVLMEGAAKNVKKVSLELGGNSPFIVFDDADVDLAVHSAMGIKFSNGGQVCISANRIFVQDGIYDTFARKLLEAVAGMNVGNGFEEGVTMGPLITSLGLSKVERLVEDAVAKGSKVLTGGKRHSLGGTFYEPTVLADNNSNMDIFSEEIFGPVAPLYRFRTEEEVLELANNTQYGLGAYMFTRDMARGWRVAERLEYGMVGWNGTDIGNEASAFGGWKQSGLGREGSKYGIEEFLEIKSICVSALAG